MVFQSTRLRSGRDALRRLEYSFTIIIIVITFNDNDDDDDGNHD